MKIIFTIFLLIGLTFKGFGQEISISETIKDKSTKQAISYGTVGIRSYGIGTTTRESGNFRLKFLSKDIGSKLVFSCIGYQSDTMTIVKDKLIYRAFLNPINSALNEVVVTFWKEETYEQIQGTRQLLVKRQTDLN